MRFTDASRERLPSPDAVDGVAGGRIRHADRFKIEALARCSSGGGGRVHHVSPRPSVGRPREVLVINRSVYH